MVTKVHPHLRVVRDGDDPRMYFQSTSGRSDSHLTVPPDSRSKEMTSDSPNLWPVDKTFRIYPSDVSQRAANASCSSDPSELMYALSSSMMESLPNGKVLSIPFGNLPFGIDRYDPSMDRKALKELRFKNFDELMRRFDGSPTKFCEETGYNSPTTISQLKTRKKAFGGDLARDLEKAARLEPYALESQTGIDGKHLKPGKQPAEWPFSIPLQAILDLNGRSVRDIDAALVKLVVGAQAQEMLEKQQKTRRR